MYAGIEGQPVADREVILDVEGHLVSEAVFLLFVSIFSAVCANSIDVHY